MVVLSWLIELMLKCKIFYDYLYKSKINTLFLHIVLEVPDFTWPLSDVSGLGHNQERDTTPKPRRRFAKRIIAEAECGGKRGLLYMEKRLHALCSWQLEISQISKIQSGQGNGRCSWDVFMNMPYLLFVYVSLTVYVPYGADMAYHINHRRGFLRCSFYCIGQCESLKLWNG